MYRTMALSYFNEKKWRFYYQVIRLCQVLFYSLISLVQGEVFLS